MDAQTTNLGGSLVSRAILTILFGAAAVFWPDLTIRTFVFLFSAFILLNGILDLVTGVHKLIHGTQAILTRMLTLLFGALEVGVGVYLLRHTYVRLSVFLLLIGFSLLIRGIFEIVEALFDDGSTTNRVLWIIIGLLTAIAGVAVLFQPVKGGIAFVWILGFYALITGPLLLAIALELNKAEKANHLRR